MENRKASSGFFVDFDSHVPAHAQLKSQVKQAQLYGELAPGQVLPSIRELARQLGVGDGVVRRTYRELCHIGLLNADRRKHVVAVSAPLPASESSALAQAAADQCERLIAWAGEARLSALALGRLLLTRARAQEGASPSYVVVDVCRLAARESARRVAGLWEIKVAGLSLSDFARLSHTDLDRLSAVIVNEHLQDDARTIVGERRPGVFPVRMSPDRRLQQRINRLPPGARVLIVTGEQSAPSEDKALLQQCKRLFNRQRRVDTRALSAIRDYVALVKSRQYKMILLSPLAWEQAPAAFTRKTSVVRVTAEPDPHSLEEVRVSAGVLA